MKVNFDPTYLGKLESIFRKAKTVLGIGEGIVPVITTESWVSRFFAGLNSPKESPERKVKPCGNILKALAVDFFKKWLFLFECFEGVTLVEARKGFLLRFPTVLALFKQTVIQPATRIKCLVESCGLFVVWIDSVFEGFSHSFIQCPRFCI